MKFCADIHCPQKMNPHDFGELLTYPVKYTSNGWSGTKSCTDIYGP